LPNADIVAACELCLLKYHRLGTPEILKEKHAMPISNLQGTAKDLGNGHTVTVLNVQRMSSSHLHCQVREMIKIHLVTRAVVAVMLRKPYLPPNITMDKW